MEKRKLSLDSFSECVLKADLSKKIFGGVETLDDGEGTSTTTKHCTTVVEYTLPGIPDSYGDTHSDGDFYSSC